MGVCVWRDRVNIRRSLGGQLVTVTIDYVCGRSWLVLVRMLFLGSLV